jgi:hypothetical protein
MDKAGGWTPCDVTVLTCWAVSCCLAARAAIRLDACAAAAAAFNADPPRGDDVVMDRTWPGETVVMDLTAAAAAAAAGGTEEEAEAALIWDAVCCLREAGMLGKAVWVGDDGSPLL